MGRVHTSMTRLPARQLPWCLEGTEVATRMYAAAQAAQAVPTYVCMLGVLPVVLTLTLTLTLTPTRTRTLTLTLTVTLTCLQSNWRIKIDVIMMPASGWG